MNREIKATRHLDCFTVPVDWQLVQAEVGNQPLWSWNRWPSQTGIGGGELAWVSSQTLNLSTWKLPSIAGKYYGPCGGDSNYNFWWERGRTPGATSILGIWSDLWLEHFYKALLHKCPRNTISVMPYSFRLSIHFLFYHLFCRIAMGDCTFKDIIKLWIVFLCQCLMDQTRPQQVHGSDLLKKTCFHLNPALLHSVTDWIWSGQSPLQLETVHPLASPLNSSCSGMCD